MRKAFVFLMLLCFVFCSCEKKLEEETARSFIIRKKFNNQEELTNKTLNIKYYDYTIWKSMYIDSYYKLADEGLITYEYDESFWGYLKVDFTQKGLKYKVSEPYYDANDMFETTKYVKVIGSIKKFGEITEISKISKNTYNVKYIVYIKTTPFGKYLNIENMAIKPLQDQEYIENTQIKYNNTNKQWE